MGIYDRDYYRDDSRSFLGSFGGRARVCTTLIAINVIIFLIQAFTLDRIPGMTGVSLPGWFTETYCLDVEKVYQGEIWRLFTYSFLHSISIWHILFNMLFLWWFGSAIEDLYGSREFLAFYLTAGFLAGLAYMAANALGIGGGGYVVGASGAVTAVLVVFACHYPHHTILLFFIPVPVWLLVVFQMGKDLLGLMGMSDEPIAFACHLGGAVFGFLYHYFQWRILNWIPTFGSGATRTRKTQLRVYREDPADEDAEEPERLPAAAESRPSRPEVDEHLEAKLDQVLEKVAKHGQDSLTPSEREILFRASEIYKRRRK